jgi:Tfp pilus assembly protein PilF
MALAVSGDYEAALDAFGSGASPAVAAYNQGMVLMATGQLDRAREAFARARTADPSFFPAITRLKQLAAHTGN